VASDEFRPSRVQHQTEDLLIYSRLRLVLRQRFDRAG